MRKICLVFSCVYLLSACKVASVQDELVDLKKSVDALNTAFQKYDIPQLDASTTDDYVHTNGSSAPIKKEQWLSYLQSRLEKTKTTIHNNSAFVAGVISVKGEEDGVDFSSKLRISTYWINENGKWKRAGFQDAKIE